MSILKFLAYVLKFLIRFINCIFTPYRKFCDMMEELNDLYHKHSSCVMGVFLLSCAVMLACVVRNSDKPAFGPNGEYTIEEIVFLSAVFCFVATAFPHTFCKSMDMKVLEYMDINRRNQEKNRRIQEENANGVAEQLRAEQEREEEAAAMNLHIW